MNIKERFRGIGSSTTLDSQGEQLTRKDLEFILSQFPKRKRYQSVEHSPLYPPVAENESAELVALDNGEWGIQVTMAVYDPESYKDLPSIEDHETSDQEDIEDDVSNISFDDLHGSISFSNHFENDEIYQLLKESNLEDILDMHQLKIKDAEPLPLIVVAGSLAAIGTFTLNFAKTLRPQLGEDIISAFKKLRDAVIFKLSLKKQDKEPFFEVDLRGSLREYDLILIVPPIPEAAKTAFEKAQEVLEIIRGYENVFGKNDINRMRIWFDPSSMEWVCLYVALENGDILIDKERLKQLGFAPHKYDFSKMGLSILGQRQIKRKST